MAMTLREGNTVRAPFAEDFPLEILNLLTLTELHGTTTLTLRGSPLNATEVEKNRYTTIKPSMNAGFNATYNHLEQYLAQG